MTELNKERLEEIRQMIHTLPHPLPWAAGVDLLAAYERLEAKAATMRKALEPFIKAYDQNMFARGLSLHDWRCLKRAREAKD